ncbi:trace amine-associated receptor 2-like [Oculina patagonica]
MANCSNTCSNFAIVTNKSSMEEDTLTVPLQVNYIINIIINSIACPLTVLLNVLVIMAVKRRPRLQSNANILLACLAATDVLTGLTVQPSFILWTVYDFLLKGCFTCKKIHNSFMRVLSVCSCLHLMLVTCERLLAIKFTMRYPYVVTTRNIKMAVIAVWVYSILCLALQLFANVKIIVNLLFGFALISCILFNAVAYNILYRETIRHRKLITTQQLPQEEVERFTKESKALKTTVFVVGAVALCFLPMALTLLSSPFGLDLGLKTPFIHPWIRTFGMLNSLLNPLIYCWRQKEMRRFVFRTSPAVAPRAQNDA